MSIPRKKDPYRNQKRYYRFSKVYKRKYAKNEERLNRMPSFSIWFNSEALDIWQKHKVKKDVCSTEAFPKDPRPAIHVINIVGILRYSATLDQYDVESKLGGDYILRKKNEEN